MDVNRMRIVIVDDSQGSNNCSSTIAQVRKMYKNVGSILV